MNSRDHSAVYTRSTHRMMRSALRRLARTFTPVLLFTVLVSYCSAADWSQPSRQLAAKVAAATGPGAVAFDIRNQSSLSKKDVDEITRSLGVQLSAAGLRFVAPDQAAASVAITLSESLDDFVWVAEIHQGTNEPVVAIVNVPRNTVPNGLHEPLPLVIRKTQIWSQEVQILDVAVFEEMSGQSHLAVLSPEEVSLYHFQDGRWQRDQSMAIPHARPWPRDLRGRLILRSDHLFDAYLPGIFCESSKTVPLSLACRESDDPWPLGTEPRMSAFFAPTRNFFTGVLSPGIGKLTSTAKFYAAAPIPKANYALWLFTATDGTQHLLDGVTDQVAHWNWGSDLVAVGSACDAGLQILATARGDATNDSIRAYEFPDRDPVAVSTPIDFSGSITALWPEAKGRSAIAVARKLGAGTYEAYRLTITCTE